jgi:hypothetical protein
MEPLVYELVEVTPQPGRQLLAQGWEPGLSMHVFRRAARIDEQVCREMPCPGGGRQRSILV